MNKNRAVGQFTSNRSCSPQKGCPPLPIHNIAETVSEHCDIDFEPATVGVRKVDVVLGTATIQIDVESVDTLPFSGRTLKQIRKNAHVTECKVLIPPGVEGTPFVPKLFIEGYVHKNIQYSDLHSGFIRDHEVNVPFHCIIPLTNLSGFVFPARSDKNVFNNQYIELAKNEMEGNRCITGGFTSEFFNEPIRCELNNAFTNEYDIVENFDRFGQFNSVREKMEVILVITLFQRQIQGGVQAGTVQG